MQSEIYNKQDIKMQQMAGTEFKTKKNISHYDNNRTNG